MRSSTWPAWPLALLAAVRVWAPHSAKGGLGSGGNARRVLRCRHGVSVRGDDGETISLRMKVLGSAARGSSSPYGEESLQQ